MSKSWTIIDPRKDQERTDHGVTSQSASREILKEEFLKEIGVSQNQLAQAIGVPGNRIHAIVNGTRDITADTDLRLCKFFGLTDGYFLRLQNAYDTLEAKRRIASEVRRIKRYKSDKAA